MSKIVKLNRSAIAQIESGNRKVSSDELEKFCRLYHLSADYFLGTQDFPTNQTVFVKGFNELTEHDQQEIINLISFKKAMYESSQ